MSRAPFVFLDDQVTRQSRFYNAPLSLITARRAEEVPAAFAAIEAALSQGQFVAGYAAYELGYALEPKLAPLLHKHDQPLLCFGIFKGYASKGGPSQSGVGSLPPLFPEWSEADYTARFERLKSYIEAGDIYQANLTFPFLGKSPAPLDLPALYAQLKSRQPVRYGGIIALNDTHILSLSPELFFSVKDRAALARPMKGTAARGADKAADERAKDALLVDEKQRAENLMIVDLLRNDLSMVAKSGSVKVTDLFTIETFPTLHQMTSGIRAQLKDDIAITEVFARLFPCGSITGAPKLRAMEIIAELEQRARGPYCGALGYFDPDGSASFNVAIRTLTCAPRGEDFDVRYAVGSGVVIDSAPGPEYRECLLKADIVTQSFDLIETLRWEQGPGFIRLEGHILRLMQSASRLGFTLDLAQVFRALDAGVTGKTKAQRVRLCVSHGGHIEVQVSNLTAPSLPLKLSLSKRALSQGRQHFADKISARAFYDGERQRLQALTGCDEVIFTNAAGELCEGSFTSLFLDIDGQRLTPAASSGQLPGVLRAQKLEAGEVAEAILPLDALSRADAILVGNSLRGLLPAALLSPHPV